MFVVLVCLGYREPPEGLRKPRESPRRALGGLSGAPGPPGARIKIHGNLYFLQGSKERMGGAGSSPTEGALSSASAQAGTDSPPQVLRTIAQSSLLGFCICCFGLSWAPGSSGRPSEAPGMPRGPAPPSPPPLGDPADFPFVTCDVDRFVSSRIPWGIVFRRRRVLFVIQSDCRRFGS